MTAAAASPPDRHTSTAHLAADLRARSARGSATSLLTQGLKFLLGFGSTIVLARLLVPADFGLVAMVVAVTGFVSLFRELGLAAATVQSPDIDDAQVTTLFWINVVLGGLLALVIAGLAPVIAWFYGDPRLTLIALALAPTAFMSGAACQHRALLRRQMRFGVLNAIDLAAFAAGVGVALVAAARGAGYWALVALPLTVELVNAVGVWRACRWRPGRSASYADVRRLVAFGGNITGFEVVNYWARNVDNLLLGRVWGPVQLGLYAKAYQLLMMPLELISGPIGAVATSALSRLAADSPQRYRSAAVGTIQKIGLLTMPAAVLMMIAADWLVAVVLGDQWLAAAPIVAVLGIAALTQPVGHTAGWLMVTQDRARDLMRWGFIGGAIAILSILAGLPWGAFGIATSYAVIGLLVRTPLLLWFVGRRGPVSADDYVRGMTIPFVAAIVALVVCAGMRALLPPLTPVSGLLLMVATIGVAMPATVAVLPGGRALLLSLASLVSAAFGNGRRP